MTTTAYTLFVLFAAAAIGCSLIRLLRGPTIADRLNAADVIALTCVALAVGHGWKQGSTLWLDLAMVAGLVLFVGTVAVSAFLDPDDLSKTDP